MRALTEDQRKHARQREQGRDTYRWRHVLRPAVLERDGYRCRTCERGAEELGPNERLTVHLRPESGLGGDHRLAGLSDCETHCSTCHGRADGHRAWGHDWTDDTGQTVRVHDPNRCAGGTCVVHNPSEHAMSDFRRYFRTDRGIMERLCPHGIGHPDPDCLAYRRSQGDADGVHGCDGCCR